MTAPDQTPDALEELIAEAERIAALVPTSDAGFAFTGLIAAIRRLESENADLDSIAMVNRMNMSDFMGMSEEVRRTQNKIEAVLAEVAATDLESSESLQADLAARIRAALTKEQS